jgi:Tol biopolymer transport system component
MDVVHSDETIVWNVLHDGEETGWYEASLRPVHWSVDGNYLYYTVRSFIDGFILFNFEAGLGRLNLETGETESIFDIGRDLYALSISPDSSSLGYIRTSEQPLRLVIRELSSGKEDDWIINDRYSQAGTITWAPDSRKLLFQEAEGDSWETVSYSLALVSLSDSSFIEFLQNEVPLLKTIEWLDLYTVFLEDWDQNSWTLDTSTGTLTSLPTPTSSP